MTTIFKSFFKPRADDYTTKQLMFSFTLCEKWKWSLSVVSDSLRPYQL